MEAVTAAGVGMLGASIALADEAKGKEAEPAHAFDKPPTTADLHNYLTTAEAQATLVSGRLVPHQRPRQGLQHRALDRP